MKSFLNNNKTPRFDDNESISRQSKLSKKSNFFEDKFLSFASSIGDVDA